MANSDEVKRVGQRKAGGANFNPGSVLIGLVIPFVAVVGGVAALSQSKYSVLGVPVVYFWIFLWFVLASVCLAASWYLFDRGDYEVEEVSGETREGEES